MGTTALVVFAWAIRILKSLCSAAELIRCCIYCTSQTFFLLQLFFSIIWSEKTCRWIVARMCLAHFSRTTLWLFTCKVEMCKIYLAYFCFANPIILLILWVNLDVDKVFSSSVWSDTWLMRLVEVLIHIIKHCNVDVVRWLSRDIVDFI